MKKEFTVRFAEMGDFFTLSWTAKELKFDKNHFQEVPLEMRLENLTSQDLLLIIEEHELLKHPKKVILKPQEVKQVAIKISCQKIKLKHNSVLVIKSKHQKEKIPITIKHTKI